MRWAPDWYRSCHAIGNGSTRSVCAGRLRDHKSAQLDHLRGNYMKKYVKPRFIGLGLLRDVTKFSFCFPEAD
jgi:hypothetical protein